MRTWIRELVMRWRHPTRVMRGDDVVIAGVLARVAILEREMKDAIRQLNSTTMATGDLWTRVAEYEVEIPSMARVKRIRAQRVLRSGGPTVQQIDS